LVYLVVVTFCIETVKHLNTYKNVCRCIVDAKYEEMMIHFWLGHHLKLLLLRCDKDCNISTFSGWTE